MLIGHAIVRLLMLHRGDDAYLRVGPADQIDAHFIAQPRFAPIGGNHQRRGNFGAILQQHNRAAAIGLYAFHRRGRDQFQVFAGRHRAIQRGADVPVLGNMAQCLGADFLGIEMQRKRRGCPSSDAIRDQYFANRLGVRRQAFPHAQHSQHPHTGIGQRRHPAIEFGVEYRRGRDRIGDHGLESTLGQRKAKGQADHAAPGNHHIRLLQTCAPITPSI